ncbi:DUF5977 domain-containing protein [Flavobacterium geliluteum]|uniref:DUF5977 domain-containing protein n=1 Tax=Flavobacterium geliluteum TaxID=2816120 RepID=A0A940XAP4_9FLAO|nr:DUF5977 domain-containing protein [Flavobacterium geliluteum]MBP4139801.1 hypothetical protein [Flavobacterium geliluteum]
MLQVQSSIGSNPGQNLVISESRVLGVVLKSIISNSGKITFTYSDRDVISNTKKIERIEIEDMHQKSIKKIILGYDLVTSSLETTYKNPHIPYVSEYGKRLFLTSVTEENEGVTKPSYHFSYYDYDKIPPRFSYAQDYWGYFNGEQSNSYLVSNDDYYFSGTHFSLSTLRNIFNNIGGNKKANGIYSKNGLLKTITYPTGGSNELVYEPHSYYGKKLVYPSKKGVAINISNTADQFSQSKTETTEIIPFFQERIPIYFSAGTVKCWESGWPTHHVRATLTVEVAEGGSDTFTTPVEGKGIYVVTPNGYKVYDSGSSVVAAPTISQHYIDLIEGNRYRFKVSVPFECIRGDFSTSFYDSPFTSLDANIEVGGQRLSKLIANDDENKKEVKEYYYGQLSCLSCSSGVIEPPVPSITLKTYHDWTGSKGTGDSSYSLSSTDILTLSSSTLYSLYTKQNSHIGYTSVVESIGENFAGGGISHKFMNTPIEIALPLRGLYVPGTPFNTTFGTGNEIETQYFSKRGSIYLTAKKIVNNYYLNPVLNKQVFGYSITQRDLYSGSTWSVIDKIRGYDITKYIIRSQWHYIKSTTEETYDLNGLNPVISTTNYNYNNPNHLQLSSENTINSNQETLETKYYYAPDPEMTTQPFANDLTTSNIILPPLKTQTFKSGSKLSEQLIVYDQSEQTSNLLLPKFVFTNKGIADINLNLDKKITFDKYDDKGNILQYTLENGIPVSIIWGYNKTQPIAKIENVAYTALEQYVSNLQNLSNLDDDNCMSSSCKEQNLRVALNSIRTNFSNAMVTTYTYNPLVGVTSITDPKAIPSYYEYDAFNRLKFIKDKDLNILQKYCYNYKGQQVDCSDNTSTSVVLYKSAPRSGSFTRNNCGAGGTGLSIPFSQAEGAVTSTISQADADDKGLLKFNTDGQVFANNDTNAKCIFSSNTKSRLFTRNNCALGGTPSSVWFVVAAGKYNSDVSQADADAKAQLDVDNNGQLFANTSGICTFWNTARSAAVTRNNCAAGGNPETVTYTVPAGRYYSFNSQAEADSQAQTEINNNVQSYANENGKCTFWNAAKSGLFTRNNCAPGGSPASVWYTVAAGIYSSTDSQAAADSQAQNDVNANGQAFANNDTNAKCTFWNTAKSGLFTRNNCAPGGSPASVWYTVPAGRYSSTYSQAAADSQAQNDVNANGQSFANNDANAKCTFYSITYYNTFFNNNCGQAGTGSSHYYTLPAGAEISTVSQGEANYKAAIRLNAEGQAYANTYGECVYNSIALSGYFSKNNCPQGTISSSELFYFVQSVGTITSKISQADADAQAIIKFNADGQAYANIAGKCFYYSNPISGTFTKTNCPPGAVGSSLVYSLAYGAVRSTVSQAQADAEALDLFNFNGQAQVYYGGTCTFNSVQIRYQIYKNDYCPPGTTYPYVYYSVPYAKYQSTISQNDADNKAWADVAANAQAYANANGTCLNPGEVEE